MAKKDKAILIIGSVPYKDRPSSFGGVTVLMKDFIDYCDARRVPYLFASTNRYSGKGASLRNYLSMLLFVARKAGRETVVMCNLDLRGMYAVFPVLWLIAKCRGAKIALRRFAGSSKKFLEEHPIVKRWLLPCLRHTDLTLFETKEQVAYFRSFGIRTEWFPNVRKRLSAPKSEEAAADYRRRFVFMGHVKKEKGIGELVGCFRRLSRDYQVDIYGRPVDYTAEELEGENIHYKGILQPEEVCGILKQYDALILPSYKEGYPGVVIEAFSAGLPCIATACGGIPEIIDDGVNGFLIKPRSADDLLAAIKRFDEADRPAMSKQAFSSFERNFESETVNDRIISELISL